MEINSDDDIEFLKVTFIIFAIFTTITDKDTSKDIK